VKIDIESLDCCLVSDLDLPQFPIVFFKFLDMLFAFVKFHLIRPLHLLELELPFIFDCFIRVYKISFVLVDFFVGFEKLRLVVQTFLLF
jgi:hypothetical protein